MLNVESPVLAGRLGWHNNWVCSDPRVIGYLAETTRRCLVSQRLQRQPIGQGSTGAACTAPKPLWLNLPPLTGPQQPRPAFGVSPELAGPPPKWFHSNPRPRLTPAPAVPPLHPSAAAAPRGNAANLRAIEEVSAGQPPGSRPRRCAQKSFDQLNEVAEVHYCECCSQFGGQNLSGRIAASHKLPLRQGLRPCRFEERALI